MSIKYKKGDIVVATKEFYDEPLPIIPKGTKGECQGDSRVLPVGKWQGDNFVYVQTERVLVHFKISQGTAIRLVNINDVELACNTEGE